MHNSFAIPKKGVDQMKLSYDTDRIPSELAAALALLRSEYPISASAGDALPVEWSHADTPGDVDVRATDDGARIRYDTLAQACRGLGWLLSLPEGATGEWHEQCAFKTLGLMLDCSRNAVMTVAQIQKWLRRMALSGYNMLMLYTEDTYALPGEPMFGFGRGAYSQQEIQAIDETAAALGIEVIPCIQTLGHLEQILKWRSAYGAVRDTNSVVLVDEPETYALIQKMLRFWATSVRSRRVHIGMDETHDLGRGRYMDRFGYKRGFDIFNEHLAQVVQLCCDEGLEPMIWSDMYFRMGSQRGDYYDWESEVPPGVAAAIPRASQLVYWDYYHTDEVFYREWIRRHRKMGFEPIMGSGVWSWGRFVYSHVYTEQTALPCVRACLAEGLQELFFTMWKDDGAAVDFDSSLAGVLYAAEAAYNGGVVDDEGWETRFAGVCQADLKANLAMCELDASERYGDEVNTRMLLWDDPLLGLYRRSLLARESWKGFDPGRYYAQLAQTLAAYAETDSGEAGNLRYAYQLATTLSLKATLYDRLRLAYADQDREMLHQLAEDVIPALAAEVEVLWEQHRQVWMAQNKAFGFEVQCVRYGGLRLRLEEVARRIEEYLANEIDSIEELELPVAPLPERFGRYRSVATTSSIL
jgi:hexosaminidase